MNDDVNGQLSSLWHFNLSYEIQEIAFFSLRTLVGQERHTEAQASKYPSNRLLIIKTWLATSLSPFLCGYVHCDSVTADQYVNVINIHLYNVLPKKGKLEIKWRKCVPVRYAEFIISIFTSSLCCQLNVYVSHKPPDNWKPNCSSCCCVKIMFSLI